MGNLFIQTKLRALYLNIFSLYFVLYRTLKGYYRPQDYLPSVGVQKFFIRTFGMNGRFYNRKWIRARVWSLETRLWLLQKPDAIITCEGDDSFKISNVLLDDVATQEEFDIVCKTKNTDYVIQALRVFTPKKEKMLEFYKTGSVKFVQVAKEIPQAFSTLTVKNVFEYPFAGRDYQLAEVLVYANPEKWVVPVMKFLDEHRFHNQEDVMGLFEVAFNEAFRLKLDISSLMPTLRVHYPSFYKKILDKHYLYNDFTPYICIMLNYELQNNILNFVTLDESLANNPWLRLAVNSRNILCYNRIFSCWQIIEKKTAPRIEKEFFQHLLKNIKHSDVIETMLCTFVGDSERIGNIIHRVGFLAREENLSMMYNGTICKEVLSYFPFTSTDFNTYVGLDKIKPFLEQLIEVKAFPVERISELSEDLQKFVFQKLEEQSQCDLLSTNDLLLALSTREYMPAYNEAKSLVDCRFEIKAERQLLSKSTDNKFVIQYLEETRIHDSNYYHFLKEKNAGSIFTISAKAHNITKKNYIALMASRYSYLAPELKQYVVE